MTKTNGLAQEAIKFFKSLYKIEKEAQEKDLSTEERHNLRQQKSVAILQSFKNWLDTHLTKTSPQSKIYEAIRYSLANWEYLNNYLNDGRVEIDNNLLENAIRPFALGRITGYLMAVRREQKLALYFIRLLKPAKQIISILSSIFAQCYIKFVSAITKRTVTSCYLKIFNLAICP
jgi:transposase